MANIRVKDLPNTDTLVDGDELIVDSSSAGTRRVSYGEVKTEIAADYVAAPSTYKVATLAADNKLDPSQIPDTISGGYNFVGVANNVGDLTSTTQGDFYVIQTAFGAYSVGDRAVYDGSAYVRVTDGTVLIEEGGTGAITAATARTNLSVNSVDEDAEATGTKLVGPALYFDGVNDYLQVADDSKLTFSSSAEFGTNSSGTWSPDDNTPALTDGTGTTNQHYRVDSGAGTVTQGASTLSVINGTATTAGQAVYYDGSVWRLKDVDDVGHTISFWAKPETISADGTFISKFDSAAADREWRVYLATNNRIYSERRSESGANLRATYSSAGVLTLGQWQHVAVVFHAAGPNSGTAFTAATHSIYVNGLDVSDASSSVGTYTGMSETSGQLRIGARGGADYFKGEIRNVQLYNRELSASEIADLAKGNDLGFADEWGGALGGVESSDFSAGDDGYSTVVNATATGNTDGVDGVDDTLAITDDATASIHSVGSPQFVMGVGKRYRLELDYYIPSANATLEKVHITQNNGNTSLDYVATKGAWTRYSTEILATAASNRIRFYGATSGSATSYSGSGETFNIKNIVITEIGTLADFRAENYDSDTGKIYDLSSNGFVGTSANLPTLTGRAYPVYETGTWTPSLYFSGTSAATYSAQSGYYTRIGNTVYVRGSISVSGVGASSGSVSVAGLPFQPSSDGASSSIAGCYMTSAANLTSQPIGLVYDGVSLIELYDAGATGNTALDETNITASTVIKVSATYQIQ